MNRLKIESQKVSLNIAFKGEGRRGKWRFVEGRKSPNWVEQYTYCDDLPLIEMVERPTIERGTEKTKLVVVDLHEDTHYPTTNPWECVQNFMRLRRDVDLLAFLNDTGHFCDPNNSVGRWDFEQNSPAQQQFEAGLLRQPVTAFWAVQQMLATMLKRRRVFPDFKGLDRAGVPKHWHSEGVSRISLEKRFGEPALTVTSWQTLETMIHWVQFAILRGARFRFCARRDCGAPFEVSSEHQRDFCSQRCSHVHWQRKDRGTKVRVLDDRKQYGFGKY